MKIIYVIQSNPQKKNKWTYLDRREHGRPLGVRDKRQRVVDGAQRGGHLDIGWMDG